MVYLYLYTILPEFKNNSKSRLISSFNPFFKITVSNFLELFDGEDFHSLPLFVYIFCSHVVVLNDLTYSDTQCLQNSSRISFSKLSGTFVVSCTLKFSLILSLSAFTVIFSVIS